MFGGCIFALGPVHRSQEGLSVGLAGAIVAYDCALVFARLYAALI